MTRGVWPPDVHHLPEWEEPGQLEDTQEGTLILVRWVTKQGDIAKDVTSGPASSVAPMLEMLVRAAQTGSSPPPPTRGQRRWRSLDPLSQRQKGASGEGTGRQLPIGCG